MLRWCMVRKEWHVPKKLRISIPLGSEVSDQVSDAVLSGKITRKDEKAFWKAFDAYRDEFGQVSLLVEFDGGAAKVAPCGSEKRRRDPNPKKDEDKPLCPEGMTRSVGGLRGWHIERFTNGKWVRVSPRLA